MLNVICPCCAAHLQVDRRYCNQQAICGQCSQSFTVQGPPAPTSPPRTASPSQTRPTLPDRASNKVPPLAGIASNLNHITVAFCFVFFCGFVLEMICAPRIQSLSWSDHDAAVSPGILQSAITAAVNPHSWMGYPPSGQLHKIFVVIIVLPLGYLMWAGYSLAKPLTTESPWIWMVGAVFPLVMWYVFFTLNTRARRLLRQHGVPVGFWGVSEKDVRILTRQQSPRD